MAAEKFVSPSPNAFVSSKMPSSIKRIPILLLKTKSTPGDGYKEYFQSTIGVTYEPSFVPVLEHRFREKALSDIHNLISCAGFATPHESGKYGGIIFTSQRAVEAFTGVIRRLREESRLVTVEELLSHVPFYVVGPATARGLKALGLSCPILGEETGNGEALASFILGDYNSRWTSPSQKCPKPRLLFLVGEQRRDIIPRTLQSENLEPSHRIGVDELVVYETGEMHSFKSDFASRWMENFHSGHDIQWIVVFSPTGCRAMLESLSLLDPDTGMAVANHQTGEGRTFIATIGPTTRDYLRQEFGFEPDVCAESPSPEGVGNGIAAFMTMLQATPGSDG